MAEEKQLPNVGDIVWIEGWSGVLGIYEGYDTRSRSLRLSWAKRDLFSGIWPGHEQTFSPVSIEEISILSSREILEKVDLLIKQRDASIRRRIAKEAASAFSSSAIDIYPR